MQRPKPPSMSCLKVIFGSASILFLDMVRIMGWAGFATLSHTAQIHMSHSLNSFKGVLGDYIGDCGVIQGILGVLL